MPQLAPQEAAAIVKYMDPMDNTSNGSNEEQQNSGNAANQNLPGVLRLDYSLKIARLCYFLPQTTLVFATNMGATGLSPNTTSK